MKKRLFALLGFAFMAVGVMSGSKTKIEQTKAADTGVETVSLFSEGVWNTELVGTPERGAASGGSALAMDGNNLKVTGWPDYLVFKNALDLSELKDVKINFTYKAETNAVAAFSTVEKNAASAPCWTETINKSNMSICDDFNTVSINLSDYVGITFEKSSWGTDHKIDESTGLIWGFRFAIGGSGIVYISEISYSYKLNIVAPETEVLFANGEWNTEVTGAVTYGGNVTPSIKDGALSFKDWSTPRAVFANAVDFTRYASLKVTLASGGWTNSGFINAYGTGGDVAGFYDAGSSLAVGEWNMPLDSSLYTATKSGWGTTIDPAINVDLSAVKGFSFKSSNEILITSIVGVIEAQQEEPEYEEEIPEGTEFVFIKNLASEEDLTIKGVDEGNLTFVGEETIYPVIKLGNTGLFRQQLKKSVNLSEAYYQSGVFHFSYKTNDASKLVMRLFSGSGDGDMPAVQWEVTDLVADGEFHEVTKNLNDLPTWTNFSSWTGSEAYDIKKSVVFDYRSVNGFGASVYATNTEASEVTVAFDNVYVDYAEKTRTLTGLEVTAEPAAAKYQEGEKFAPYGMEVSAVFDDSTKTKVMPMKFEAPKDGFTLDNKEVKVRYTHGTDTVYASYEVTIDTLQRISIDSNPTLLKYVAGEKIDLTGLVVKAYDGVQDLEVENSKLNLDTYYAQETAGTQTITVSYGGKTATFDITVVKDDAEKLEVLGESFFNGTGDGFARGSYEAKPSAAVANSEIVFDIANTWSGYRYTTDFAVNANSIYNDSDGITTVQFVYKTDDVNSIKFGLGNKQDDGNYYFADKLIDLQADGEYHTAVVRLDYFADVPYTHEAWSFTNAPEGVLDLTNIGGYGFFTNGANVGHLTVKSICFAWAEEELEAYIVDKFGPSIELDPSIELTQEKHYGDTVDVDAILAKVSVNDGTDSVLGREMSKHYKWSEGALTDGKLNGGTHTLTIWATDKAGNKTDADKQIIITFNVAVSETGIELNTSAVKKEYTVGDDFSSTGLTVKVVKEDGTKVDVALADCEIEGFSSAAAGEVTITVKYHSFSATYTVNVAEAAPVDPVDPVEPHNPAKKTGCGGSVVVASSLIAVFAFAGVGLIAGKRKED